MRNNKNCYTLPLNISTDYAFRADFDTTKFRKTGSNPSGLIDMWHIPYSDLGRVFNLDWIESLKEFGINTTRAMILFRDPSLINTKLHVDISGDEQICSIAFNFVLDPHDDGQMIWYELNDPSEENILSDVTYVTEKKFPMVSYDIDTIDGKEAAKINIGTDLTMVRTDVPHSVETGTRPRWAFSLRCDDLTGWTWQDAVQFFSAFAKN